MGHCFSGAGGQCPQYSEVLLPKSGFLTLVHPVAEKTKTGRAAFAFALNQWDALCRYPKEGFLSFDNTLAERTVIIPAIVRKNYLFVSSIEGGRRAAIHDSLVSSAKANGVEPFAWPKGVFMRLPYHRDGEAFAQSAAGQPFTSDEPDYLLPDIWLRANPTHAWTINAIRRTEREKRTCSSKNAHRVRTTKIRSRPNWTTLPIAIVSPEFSTIRSTPLKEPKISTV